ncbi:site-specific integrase [Klebsiella variicola]|uniref:site-specific integrase n=1 Tax=Klebsiella variicola TaxID=244366 RepID=UPI00164CC8DC|nr:site-specific integrase [Klebsiella variicola]MBC5099489.1 site-specific integrase [Klebsiella variicola]
MINQTILKEEFNIRYSMAGYEFDLREKIWNLKRGVIINLSFLDDFLEKIYHEGFIHTLSYFAQVYKPESVSSFVVKIKAIMFGYNVRTFSEHELITAYSDLQSKDYEKFIMFKSFIIKWKELGYYGIDDNAYEYLKVITIPTSIHGDVVKRRDPKLGPFNDLEIRMIVDGLETGINRGTLSEYCYIFTRILLLSGRRPIQIMSLKHRDVIKNEGGYFLRIPRAKQKNNVFRGTFREIEITEEIWQYLMKVMVHNIDKVKEIIAEDLNENFFDDLPIFLSIPQLCKVSDGIDFSKYLQCDFLHIRTGQARFWLKDFAKKFKIYSPRTGELLKIHPVRFRYTFGTLLARSEGNLSTIAFAMDHSSDTSAGCYIKNLPDNVNVIDKAVERYLTDISDVFLGKRGYQGDLLQKALTMDIKKENKNNRNCDGCQHFKAWNRRGDDSLNI